MEKGKFVVIEGIDGSGKSSTLREVKGRLNNETMVFTKGFGHHTPVEKYIDSHPHSIMYYLSLLYKNQTEVVPALKSGTHVIQDRYKQTVDTFEPDASYLINRAFLKAVDPLFLQPNIYIQFLARVETIVRRLADEKDNEYHQSLIANPQLIEERQARYREAYTHMRGEKYEIDTTDTTVAQAADQMITIFERNGLC